MFLSKTFWSLVLLAVSAFMTMFLLLQSPPLAVVCAAITFAAYLNAAKHNDLPK